MSRTILLLVSLRLLSLSKREALIYGILSLEVLNVLIIVKQFQVAKRNSQLFFS